MTLADWIIGFAFGFGVIICAVGLWRSLCDSVEQVARFDLRYPVENVEPTTDNPWRAVMTPASHLYRLPASPAAANSRATTDGGSSKGR